MSDIILTDEQKEIQLIDDTQPIIEKWEPNLKQASFLSVPFSIKEAFYGGGAGSGKSDVLLMYGIVHRFYLNPKFKQVFMRRTHADLKKEIVQRSRDIFKRFGATFNGSDMVWTFPSPGQPGSGYRNDGAMIFLGHCENESDVHSYDSMEISLFTPDELTNCTEYIYLYITQERNRAPKGSGLPSITRGAGMPGGIGHTFVKKRFVDPHPAGNVIIKGKGGNLRIYVHATLADNLEHIDPSYSQSLDGRPEAERKAKKFGDWSAYLGQVFDEFRDKKYPDEPPNAIHAIEPFEIPSWWPRFVVGDWGMRAMTYIAFLAVSPDRRVYVYRELHWTGSRIEEWAPVLSSFVERENPRLIKFCRSTGQDHGHQHTIQQQIESALSRTIELSNHSQGSRIAGKMLLHEYLRWKPKPLPLDSQVPVYSEEKARYILRNKGLIEYKAYLSIFNPPEEETAIPKLQIFCCNKDDHDGHPDCCPVLINSIKACSYDKPRNNKPAEDVAEFDGDDPYDTIRYGIDTAEQFFDDASDDFQRMQREAAVMQKLHEDQDHTAFYRQMRTIESAGKTKPVRMFHSGKRR